MTAPKLVPLLTVREAAKLLAVGEQTVRRMLDDGQLAKVQVRGAVRVREAEIAEWLDPKKDGPSGDGTHAGNMLERAICDWYAVEMGGPALVESTTLRHRGWPRGPAPGASGRRATRRHDGHSVRHLPRHDARRHREPAAASVTDSAATDEPVARAAVGTVAAVDAATRRLGVADPGQPREENTS